MFTRDDLVDAIMAQLLGRPAARPASPDKPAPRFDPDGPRGRLFLTEFDIKKRLTAGDKRLTLARNAIVSPLASDWLVLNGITIERE